MSTHTRPARFVFVIVMLLLCVLLLLPMASCKKKQAASSAAKPQVQQHKPEPILDFNSKKSAIQKSKEVSDTIEKSFQQQDQALQRAIGD